MTSDPEFMLQRHRPVARVFALVFAAAFLFAAPPAEAYVGPGAGFAFFTSFFVFFLTFLLAVLALLTWPIRYLIKTLRRRPAAGRRLASRVVIVGLDGMDPELAERFMAEGRMPHMKRLAETGAFRRLRTTTPAISPVAWSSFATGCNPGRHNIFDFLTRDPRTYLPLLSSAEVGPSPRTLNVGRYAIPLGKPTYRLMRKSKAFWTLLGEHGIFSSVVRVPITFPPEKFHGVMLSAMGAPDLRGTQGTFSFYTSRPGAGGEIAGAEHTGGVRIPVEVEDGMVRGHIVGPVNSMLREPKDILIPFTARIVADNAVLLEVGREKVRLERRKFSPWVRLSFPAAPLVSVKGIVLFYLNEISPHFELYMTPINIDPQNSALPVSHPVYYSDYLAKRLGDFATLGLAEDTWALNEGILDEEAFLEQAWLIDDERERMLFHDLDKIRDGAVVCVFDSTDRVQHMFMRYLDERHPGVQGRDIARYRGVMEELYTRMDRMVGKVMERLGPRDVLMVMSDHGFKQFRRGVNVNSWLYREGYLALKEGAKISRDWLADVDWSRTRAFAMGLGGLYLNLKGREAKGIVEPGAEADALLRELQRRLTGLGDDEKGAVAIEEVFAARDVYQGPYVRGAPDLILGYADGYRVSWDSAQGKVDDVIFDDNRKAWGSDHCINPERVPGVFFASRAVAADFPAIWDIAPAVLELFGVPVPAYMDGRSLWREQESAPEPRQVPAAATAGA